MTDKMSQEEETKDRIRRAYAIGGAWDAIIHAHGAAGTAVIYLLRVKALADTPAGAAALEAAEAAVDALRLADEAGEALVKTMLEGVS